MFGFIFGVLFAMGAMGFARRRRRWRRHGHPGHRGPWGHHHHSWHDDLDPGEFGSRRRGGPLGGLFARLETTPAQEREIRDAIGEVKKSARGARGRLKDLGDDLANAMRKEDLDADTLGMLLANQDSAVDEVKKELVGALARVHHVLDSDQRERLARFLERMGPRMRWA
jgi:uncharacterized membrane protein